MVHHICRVFLPIIAALMVSVELVADEPLWIDVRTAQEFNEGHVGQSVNIPYDEIANEISSVTADKDALIYLYCRSGRRSGIAKETLDRLGYSQVVNVGGFAEAMARAEKENTP
jgi:phage shock protein E